MSSFRSGERSDHPVRQYSPSMNSRARGIVIGTVLADVVIWVIWLLLTLAANGGMSVSVPFITTLFGIGLCVRVIRDARPKAAGPIVDADGQGLPMDVTRRRQSRAVLLTSAVATSVGGLALIVIGGLAVRHAHQNHSGTHALQAARLKQANGELGSGVLLLLLSLVLWLVTWWQVHRKPTPLTVQPSGSVVDAGSASSTRARKALSPRTLAIYAGVRVLGLFVIVGMGIWLVIGGWHGRSLTRPISGGVTTTGHVVKVVINQGKSTTYAAVVEFHTSKGVAERFQGQFGSNRPVIGSAATVSYSASDPTDAHDLTDNPDSWKWPFFTGVFVLVIGISVLAFVGTVLVRRRSA